MQNDIFFIALLMYVDEILVFVDGLHAELRYFLGIEIPDPPKEYIFASTNMHLIYF